LIEKCGAYDSNEKTNELLRKGIVDGDDSAAKSVIKPKVSIGSATARCLFPLALACYRLGLLK
jgi:hypothetical protein